MIQLTKRASNVSVIRAPKFTWTTNFLTKKFRDEKSKRTYHAHRRRCS